jgi:hypothetical protein
MPAARYSFRPVPDELRRQYLDLHLGGPEIAFFCGCDSTTARHWLVAAGVEMRSRGHDRRQHFKAGQPSPFKGRRMSAESRAKVGAATRSRPNKGFMQNGVHYLKGAAPEKNPRWLGGLTPERQAFYRSPEWKAACVTVWHRADARCECCGLDSRLPHAKAAGFHVHHILTFQVRETRADPGNLILLCRYCHSWVHGKDNPARYFLALPIAQQDAEMAIPTLFDLLESEAA